MLNRHGHTIVVILALVLGPWATPRPSMGQPQGYQLFFVLNPEFETNIGGWFTVYENRLDDIPVGQGTVEWSPEYGGSAHFRVSGAPCSVRLLTEIRTVLFPGDKILIGLHHSSFPIGTGAGATLRGGNWGEQVSTSAAAPEEDIELELEIKHLHLPGAFLELFLVSWPGEGDAWFKYVKLVRGGMVDWNEVTGTLGANLLNTLDGFSLYQNYPNPFNPSTTIAYDLGTEERVSVEIFDLQGRKVKTLLDKVQGPGRHTVVWDGTDEDGMSVPSGTYMYVVRTEGGKVQTKKAILLK